MASFGFHGIACPPGIAVAPWHPPWRLGNGAPWRAVNEMWWFRWVFFHGKITMLTAVKMGDLPWIFWGLVHKTKHLPGEEKSLSKSRVDRHLAPGFSDTLLSLLELAGHIPTSTWEHLIQYWMDGWMDESLHVYIYIIYYIYIYILCRCRCRCRYTYVMYVYHRISSYIHIITSRPPPGRQALNRAPPSTLTSTWVCLKIVYPNQPNGFADHYPY